MSFSLRPTVYCDDCDHALEYERTSGRKMVLRHPRTGLCKHDDCAYSIPEVELEQYTGQ